MQKVNQTDSLVSPSPCTLVQTSQVEGTLRDEAAAAPPVGQEGEERISRSTIAIFAERCQPGIPLAREWTVEVDHRVRVGRGCVKRERGSREIRFERKDTRLSSVCGIPSSWCTPTISETDGKWRVCVSPLSPRSSGVSFKPAFACCAPTDEKPLLNLQGT